jgi:two-component system sensor histidine kinase VicK
MEVTAKTFNEVSRLMTLYAPNRDHFGETTTIIEGRKSVLQEAFRRSLTSVHDFYCITGDELAKSYKPFVPLLQIRVIQRAGSTQILTNIEKITIPAVRELTRAGAQVRHIDSTELRRCVIYDDEAAYFSIVEEPIITHEATNNADETEGKDLWVASTEFSVIQSAKNRFLSDWENAVPSESRIAQLESGCEPEFYKVLTDGEYATQLIIDLTRSARKEALFFLPNDKSIMRASKIGIVDLLIKASKTGVKVKIICPMSIRNKSIMEEIESASQIELLNGYDSTYGMYIFDGERIFRDELRQPMAENFSDAVGLAVYSNRRITVDSFKSVFELLWKESTLVEELRKTDQMQKEFINIAAHELRTPMQPILGLSEELLTMKGKIEKYHHIISAISRNARRLQRLTDDVLDITRIESGSLMLIMQSLNLKDLVSDTVADYRNHDSYKEKKIDLLCDCEQYVFVEGDKERLTQVICNLMSNAVKFTEKVGVISVTIERRTKPKQVIVSIADNGKGLSPEIYPRLFTKFVTTSMEGTGLGLYISKKIVEAHGGRIWAENNSDSKGATFCFSLPIARRKIKC